MTLKLYNSYTKSLEEFRLVTAGEVTMYNCGPTVYGYAHIGNFRSFLLADLLRRYLTWKGYAVKQVMNITDVGHLTDDGDEGEDKLEVTAKKEKKHPLEIARFYTEKFIEDWRTLNMLEPMSRPRATEYVNEMIAMIKELLQKGHAYEAHGNVYYDITTFPEYGTLSGNTLERLGNHRVEIDPSKRNPQDFVLWFGHSKYENHILQWDSPWGKGYPGWHIECSAMSAKLLTQAFNGNQFDADAFTTIDIHTGGEDNKFPHHECEIAQTTGATDKPFANYWLHASHLKVEGEKMSKSLGNIYYIFDLVQQGYSPRSIRYLLMSAHYRQTLNFTKEGLLAAQKSLDRIDEVLRRLDAVQADLPYDEPLGLALASMRADIEGSLDDDLNISGALGALFEGIRAINAGLQEGTVGIAQARETLQLLLSYDRIFGFIDAAVLEKEELPKEVADLLLERATARNAKDWKRSDELRDEIRTLGYEVKDTPQGQETKRW